jgi:hypothetical protein
MAQTLWYLEANLLQANLMVDAFNFGGWAPVYHVFDNDFHPVLTSTLADFSEASFLGYAPVQAAPAGNGWQASVGAPPDQANVTYVATALQPIAFQSIVFNTDVLLYGCYVTDLSNLTLYFAQRFDVPFHLVGVGGFQLVPTFILRSRFAGP